MDSIPEPRRSSGGGHGNPLQYSYLQNPMDRGACQATVHRVAKSWTWLKWLNMQWERCEKSESASNFSEAWHEVSKQPKNQSVSLTLFSFSLSLDKIPWKQSDRSVACFYALLLDLFLIITHDVQWLARHIMYIEIVRSAGIMWNQREKIPAFKNDWVAQIRSDHTLKMEKRSKPSPLSYLHQGESHSNVPSWKLILQLSSTGNVLAFASYILAERWNGESSCLWLRNTPIVFQTTNICCWDTPNPQVFFDFPCPWYQPV